MTENTPADRRKKPRAMRFDRRKSDLDVIEHVALGVRRSHVRATSDDRPLREPRLK
jgi:hypothetical protein